MGFVVTLGLAWTVTPVPADTPPERTNPPGKSQRRAAHPPARDDEDPGVRQAITNWFVRIRAIRSGRLDGPGRSEGSAFFKKGREQILAIQDPLAIPALAGVLSGGSTATRRLLVEVLEQFPDDEATLNLLIVGLYDPAPAVRRAAAVALIPRKEPRVVELLREGLNSEEEEVLRNAASALGVLRAKEAIEDLIPLLETKTVGPVSVQRDVYFEGACRRFCHPTRVMLGGRRLIHVPYFVGVLEPGTVIGTYWDTEIGTISVYRTEVQEALIAITGKNFGFDVNAWREWWRHEPREKPTGTDKP